MAAVGVVWKNAIMPSGGSRLWAGTAGWSLRPISARSACEHAETGALANRILMLVLLCSLPELCEYLPELRGYLLGESKRRGQLVHHLWLATGARLTFPLK